MIFRMGQLADYSFRAVPLILTHDSAQASAHGSSALPFPPKCAAPWTVSRLLQPPPHQWTLRLRRQPVQPPQREQYESKSGSAQHVFAAQTELARSVLEWTLPWNCRRRAIMKALTAQPSGRGDSILCSDGLGTGASQGLSPLGSDRQAFVTTVGEQCPKLTALHLA